MDQNAQDIAEIDAIARSFYAAFTNAGGARPRLDDLERLFLGSAVIVKALPPEPAVYSVRSFIEPRAALLLGGGLTEFREEEIEARTIVLGNLGQRLSLYCKSGNMAGERFEGRGVKMLQLVRTPVGWRISALAWDDEREGLTLPDTL